MGVAFVVRCAGNGASRLAEEISQSWSWCLGHAAEAGSGDPIVMDVVIDPRGGVVAGLAAEETLAGPDLATVLHDLSPRITLAAITRREHDLFTIHAGGVADLETGKTVAMVGASGAGKTTATAVLARQFGYVSDETIALRDDDSILAYPKPLSVLGDRAPLKDQISPDLLGFQLAPDHCRLVKVLYLHRTPDGPTEPYLEPMSTVRAIAELAPQISFLATRDKPLQRLAVTLRATGGMDKVHYREAASLGPLVAGLMGEGR